MNFYFRQKKYREAEYVQRRVPSIENFEIFLGGFPHFGPSKLGVSKNEHPSTTYDPTLFVQNPFLL